MKSILTRVLPLALALLMPAAAHAESSRVGTKDHPARTTELARTKAKPKAKTKVKTKAKAKPAKSRKVTSTKAKPQRKPTASPKY